MKNNKGFISMSLVYSFLIIFLFLMVAIIACYSQKNSYLEALDSQVSNDLNTTLSTKLSLYKTIINDNETDNISNIIKDSYISKGNGVYVISDKTLSDENNDGYTEDMYIYRGDVDNNYVVFGSTFKRDTDDNNKIIDSTVKKMCWKILRTNEDRSVRLVYYGVYEDGKCVQKNLDMTAFNTNDNDNAYVGYTYGNTNANSATETHNGSNKSTINENLDNWITTNTNLANSKYGFELKDNTSSLKSLDEYLVDNVFCCNKNTEQEGYSTKETIYESNSKTMPSYVCNEKNSVKNIYTLNPELGGLYTNTNTLDNKVGLLSIDDVMLAGGNKNKSSKFFLNYGINYWTMSPSKFSTNAYVYYVSSDGKIEESIVSASNIYILPVINLSESIKVSTGKGTNNKPYILSEA